MSKFKAAEDIKKFGRYMSGLIEFAQELERVGSMEQSVAEIASRLEELRMKEIAALEAAKAADAKLGDVVAKGQALEKEAAAQAAAIVAKAHEEAARIKQDATADAFGKKAEALAHVAKLGEEIVARKLELEKLHDELAVDGVKLHNLKVELEQLKKRIGG